mgnify:CR=1 FL=1
METASSIAAKATAPIPPAKARWRPDLTASHTPVSYTHLRAHETVLDLVCHLLLEKKKPSTQLGIRKQVHIADIYNQALQCVIT